MKKQQVIISITGILFTFLCFADVRFPDDAGIIDVTDPFIGVTPNDGTDDTAALQRLFDILSPGKIVYFPAGQYDFSAEVRLEKNDVFREAESLVYSGWNLQTEGSRTFLVAADIGTGPDDAGRIIFDFDAITSTRILRLTHRVPNDNSNSFYYRVNGGPWRANGRPFNGNSSWRENAVVTTNIVLGTQSNRLEIAAREVGFEIDNLAIGYLGNYLNNTIIQGQSEDTTTLKLLKETRNTDDSPFNGALIAWESGVEQFFRTAVRDLTIDVGTNNPLARGLKFHGNNQSVISNVTINGENGSGDVGLDLAHTAAIGPILVRNLTVNGFNTGIHTAWQNASRTFENITLNNQREYGWVNEAASTIWVRNLTSNNSVSAFRNDSWRLAGDGQGRVVLVDSHLNGINTLPATWAISSLGNMYARNITTSGYDIGLINQNQAPFRGYRGQDGIDGIYIDEWWTSGQNAGAGGGMTRMFADTPDTAVRLPVNEVPDVPSDDPTLWDGPQNHLIELEPGVFSGIVNDDIDDSPSLQAAIDSGAQTVYLPSGTWRIETPVELRGQVNRLLGIESRLSKDSLNDGKIVIGETGPSTVVIERFANFGSSSNKPVFEHASSRTLVFKDLTGLNYRSSVSQPGDLYISDTVGDALKFQGGQRVWARQLNIEQDTTDINSEFDAKIINDGANVWVLGFKTENAGIHIKTINGGITELLGNLQNNSFTNQTVQYVTEDATFSVVTNIKPIAEKGTTYGSVEETRQGVTQSGIISGTGYVAMSTERLWLNRSEIIIDDDHPSIIYQGDWSTSSGFPRGYIGENFSYASAGTENSANYPVDIIEAGTYAIYTRWIGDWGGQDHSGHATTVNYQVNHQNGSELINVNQDNYSDGWYLLGEYDFAQGQIDVVILTGDGADGRINTDGIKLKLTQPYIDPDIIFINGFESL